MIKISTLFKKDPSDLGRVINEVNPENQWVMDGEGTPYKKWDGTACAIINGDLYKRYDVKKGKTVPEGAIPCQEPDKITGHWPHWVKCNRNDNADKYHFEAFDLMFEEDIVDGTYELVGPKVNGNNEGLTCHELFRHDCYPLFDFDLPHTFDSLKNYLTNWNIEGIVFHHQHDGRMCKIRKSDFGIKR